MKVAIIGSSKASDENIIYKSKKIGVILASKSYIVVTGGVPGYPDIVAQSTISSGGKAMAYCAGKSIRDHNQFYKTDLSKYSEIIFQDKYVDVTFSKIDLYFRSIKLCFDVDFAVVIGGRVGTMNEVTILAGNTKDIYVLDSAGGISNNTIKQFIKEGHKEQSKILYFSNPSELDSFI